MLRQNKPKLISLEEAKNRFAQIEPQIDIDVINYELYKAFGPSGTLIALTKEPNSLSPLKLKNHQWQPGMSAYVDESEFTKWCNTQQKLRKFVAGISLNYWTIPMVVVWLITRNEVTAKLWSGDARSAMGYTGNACIADLYAQELQPIWQNFDILNIVSQVQSAIQDLNFRLFASPYCQGARFSENPTYQLLSDIQMLGLSYSISTDDRHKLLADVWTSGVDRYWLLRFDASEVKKYWLIDEEQTQSSQQINVFSATDGTRDILIPYNVISGSQSPKIQLSIEAIKSKWPEGMPTHVSRLNIQCQVREYSKKMNLDCPSDGRIDTARKVLGIILH